MDTKWENLIEAGMNLIKAGCNNSNGECDNCPFKMYCIDMSNLPVDW